MLGLCVCLGRSAGALTTASHHTWTCSRPAPDAPCADAQKSIALPDMHSGYGFAIGNVAAFDMADPQAVVSPGGVGFDINCGVRLIRTNLVRRAAPWPVALPDAARRALARARE